MAITIKSAPSGFTSANEEVWHVVDSNNKNVIGFKYLYDIYKGATLQTRITNSPYGSDDYGVLNVGNIVRAGVAVDNIGDLNMATNYNDGITPLTAGADYWFTEYDVRFGEICGVTTTENMASGTYRVYNTYNRHPMHKAGAALSSGTVFLTNRPDESYFYSGEPVVISINGKRLSPGNLFEIQVADGEDSFAAVDGFHYFSINNLETSGNLVVSYDDDVLATKQLKKRCSK
jgi:hypothetical protein